MREIVVAPLGTGGIRTYMPLVRFSMTSTGLGHGVRISAQSWLVTRLLELLVLQTTTALAAIYAFVTHGDKGTSLMWSSYFPILSSALP